MCIRPTVSCGGVARFNWYRGRRHSNFTNVYRRTARALQAVVSLPHSVNVGASPVQSWCASAIPKEHVRKVFQSVLIKENLKGILKIKEEDVLLEQLEEKDELIDELKDKLVKQKDKLVKQKDKLVKEKDEEILRQRNQFKEAMQQKENQFKEAMQQKENQFKEVMQELQQNRIRLAALENSDYRERSPN